MNLKERQKRAGGKNAVENQVFPIIAATVSLSLFMALEGQARYSHGSVEGFIMQI